MNELTLGDWRRIRFLSVGQFSFEALCDDTGKLLELREATDNGYRRYMSHDEAKALCGALQELLR